MIMKHRRLGTCIIQDDDANVILVRSCEDDGRRLEGLASSWD